MIMEKHVEQNTRQSSGINIGSASIIMVFSVLCLTVFAVLTFVTANNEYKLSVKSADQVKAYYAADESATETMAKIETIVKSSGSYGLITNEVSGLGVTTETTDKGLILSYTEKMDDYQELRVKLLYDGTRLSVKQWKLVNTAEWNAGEMTILG